MITVIGDVRREFIFYGLELGLEKAKAKLDLSRIHLHNRAENKVGKRTLFVVIAEDTPTFLKLTSL